MVKKTIPELDDGAITQSKDAEVAFSQGGATFRGPIRPNPVDEINVRNQAQLEAEFGTDIEIPDNSNLTIFIDDSFTLDKPFKFGENCNVEVRGSTVGKIITWTGTGAIFQNINPALPVDTLFVREIRIIGDGNNSLFDGLVGVNSLVIDQLRCGDFDSIGTTTFQFYGIQVMTINDIEKGWIMIDPVGASMLDTSLTQNFGVPVDIMTFITIVTAAFSGTSFRFVDNFLFDFASGGKSTFFFFDPNALAGTLITAQRHINPVGPFYQTGLDITVNSVTDNTSGQTRFTTATAHGLAVGMAVVNSGFATGAYNGTKIVIAVDVADTGVTYDVDIPIGADETGTMNKSSMDSTNVLVFGENNRSSEDSMFTGETGVETFGADISSSSLAQDAFEVITSVLWASANLERFIEGVANTGQMVGIDPQVRKYNVSYSATLEKMGGGSTDIGIILLKNGVIESFNPPHTVNTGKIQITGTDLVELVDTDTLDIAVINYDSTAATILISQAGLVTSRA